MATLDMPNSGTEIGVAYSSQPGGLRAVGTAGVVMQLVLPQQITRANVSKRMVVFGVFIISSFRVGPLQLTEGAAGYLVSPQVHVQASSVPMPQSWTSALVT
jgi:hypothetical protein